MSDKGGFEELVEFFFSRAGRLGKTGWFFVLRRTMRKRLRKKVREIKEELYKRRHQPVAQIGRWLGSVLTGHYRYYGVPHNIRRLSAFRHYVLRGNRSGGLQ